MLSIVPKLSANPLYNPKTLTGCKLLTASDPIPNTVVKVASKVGFNPKSSVLEPRSRASFTSL